MSLPIFIRVYEDHRLVCFEEFDGPVELGRQSEADEDAYTRRFENGRWRFVIARQSESGVSRRQALIEPIEAGWIRLTNYSAVSRLRLPDGTELAPGSTVELPTPASLTIGPKSILIGESSPEEDSLLRSLETATPKPELLTALRIPPDGGIDVEGLLRWLETIMGVLQTAASSSDFYQRAALGVVEIVGFDSGRVLLFDGVAWQTQAVAQPDGSIETMSGDDFRPSRRVLSLVQAEKRTYWFEPDSIETESLSLTGVVAVVASPILDRLGDVIGCLYGERRQGGVSGRARASSRSPQISRLEAMLVQVLASGVAAGLARVEQERAALAARVQFEQFFTPELAQVLEQNPAILSARAAEVTVLYADIRDFHRHSARLGPDTVVSWLQDVLGVLSDCALSHSGVLVDYQGDGLLAMWGAPHTQEDHATLACRAGLAMVEALPRLDERWRKTLGETVRISVAVNTGIALVGNTGSRRKFKYGPVGNVVTVVWQLERLAKTLGITLLAAGSTRAGLGDDFRTRRLARVRLAGSGPDTSLDVYEIVEPERAKFEDLMVGYETALASFESGDFRAAARTLGGLLQNHPEDRPARRMFSRAVQGIIEKPNWVWDLPHK
jgi:adenylate cyclase